MERPHGGTAASQDHAHHADTPNPATAALLSWRAGLPDPRRARVYAAVTAIFVGFCSLRFALDGGLDWLLLGEALGLMVGGILLWRRNAQRWVGAPLVAGGLAGLADALTHLGGGLVLPVVIWIVLDVVYVRLGMRILLGRNERAELEREARPRPSPGDGQRAARAVRNYSYAAIFTGAVYLLLALLVAGLDVALGTWSSFGAGSFISLFSFAPPWVVEVLEDLALIAAGFGMLRCRGWARTTLLVLSGLYAFEWWMGALAGSVLELKDWLYLAFWSYGFFLLSSRDHAGDFRATEASESSLFTPVEQLDGLHSLAE